MGAARRSTRDHVASKSPGSPAFHSICSQFLSASAPPLTCSFALVSEAERSCASHDALQSSPPHELALIASRQFHGSCVFLYISAAGVDFRRVQSWPPS